LKIISATKELQLSIRELASFNLSQSRGGSSILPARMRTSIGVEAHKIYQETTALKQDTSKSEYSVKIVTNVDDWSVLLRGRADVVYEEDDTVIIEEVKSTTDLSENGVRKSHVQQLQLYSHYFLLQKRQVRCNLVYFDILGNTFQKEEIPVQDMTTFIEQRCREIIGLHEQLLEHNEQQSQRHHKLKFPFQTFRPNQETIMDAVTESHKQQQRFLLRAPSGLGKTIGTLYPSLKFAIQHNLRLFVATSKTTQQKIYYDTLQKMAKRRAQFKAIVLTAKEKICNNSEFICDENICPYLANYSETKVKEALSSFENKRVLNARTIRKAANNSVICAFELSLDASLECDVIIGDYNYIFHPGIRLHRFFHFSYDNAILIIDEVHNLPARARDYYSPSITLKQILDVQSFLRNSPISKGLKSTGKSLLQRIFSYVSHFQDEIQDFGKWKAGVVKINKKKMNKLHKELDNFVLEYVREIVNIQRNTPSIGDPLVNFGEEVKYFTSILKESGSTEFSQLYFADEGMLKIFCKSAEKKLSEQMKGFYSVIAQSATLYPLDYFRKLIGYPEAALTQAYPTPFPPENQLYMVYPHISTTYSVRERYFSAIADLITHTVTKKDGNYLAFFPSFVFLSGVLAELKQRSLPLKLLVQKKNMSEKQRASYMRKLEQKKHHYILLGVHGGIFSEGVDYIGDMGIGVFIIGPGLPAYTFEQELMKGYFEETYNKGFEFAYRNPGMNKVIQAAGRIFRSSEDKGVVILIGTRFTTPFYASALPEDWDIKITSHPIDEMIEFWGHPISEDLHQFLD
jgi:DNA excision repair protein ERCC-2